jgi:hypothetical protein
VNEDEAFLKKWWMPQAGGVSFLERVFCGYKSCRHENIEKNSVLVKGILLKL